MKNPQIQIHMQNENMLKEECAPGDVKSQARETKKMTKARRWRARGCPLLSLPGEILNRIVSHLYPLRSNGRPQRRVRLAKFCSASHQKPYAFSIILTCNQLYQAAHYTAYRNVEWCLPSHQLSRNKGGRTRYASVLGSLAPAVMSDLRFMRGNIDAIESFLKSCDTSFPEVRLQNLNITVLDDMSRIRSKKKGEYNFQAFTNRAQKAMVTCSQMLIECKRLKGLEVQLRRPYERYAQAHLVPTGFRVHSSTKTRSCSGRNKLLTTRALTRSGI